MSSFHRNVFSGLCLLGTWLCACSSHAFERQWQTGIDLGSSALSYKGTVYPGLLGGAHLSYGLNDSINALLQLDASTHSVYEASPSLKLMSGAIGASYTLDVIRWVPYFGALVGGYRFSGVDLQKADYKLGLQFALGLDYHIDRSWSVGAQLRYHTFSDDPFTSVYATSALRASYLWGW